jgi:uncharacterized protein
MSNDNTEHMKAQEAGGSDAGGADDTAASKLQDKEYSPGNDNQSPIGITHHTDNDDDAIAVGGGYSLPGEAGAPHPDHGTAQAKAPAHDPLSSIEGADEKSPGHDLPFSLRTAAELRIRDWTIHPVGFGFLVLAISFVAYQILGGVATFLLFGVNVSENVQGMRVMTVISQLLFLVGPAILLLYLQPWPLRDVFRLSAPRFMPTVVTIIAVLAAQIFGQVYLDVQQHLLRTYLLPEMLLPMLDTFENMLKELYGTLLNMGSPLEMLFVLFVIGLTPAVCEELLFRGTVQYSFERAMRARWAVLLTGAIFALFHLNPITFIPLAILGSWLGFVVWRGGSIWYAIIGHAVNNSLAVLSLYFLNADSWTGKVETGELPDAGALIVGGASLVLLIVSVPFFMRLTKQRHDSVTS